MDYLLARLVDPLFMPVHPGERVYWLYLVSAFVFAGGFYATRAKRGSFRGLLRYCVPRKVLLHPSARLDYGYFVVNRIVFGLLLLPALPAAALGAAAMTRGALEGFLPALSFPGMLFLQTALSALALDLGLFIAHWLQHEVPMLWEFHKVHHSAEVLTPVTAYRMHPVDDLVSMGFSGALGGVVTGAFQVLDPGNPGPLALLGLHGVVFAYYLAGFNLRHSHVPLDYPRWLARVLISPAQHQLHHSNAPQYAGKNLGFIFSFWDAACGTLQRPVPGERLSFGLAGREDWGYTSLRRLYFMPFLRGFRVARPGQIAMLTALVVLGVALSFGVAIRA